MQNKINRQILKPLKELSDDEISNIETKKSVRQTIDELNATLPNNKDNWIKELIEKGWTKEEVKDALDEREIPHGQILPEEFINKQFGIQVKMMTKMLNELKQEELKSELKLKKEINKGMEVI